MLNKRILIPLVLGLLALPVLFYFMRRLPDWEDHEVISRNTELPHATFNSVRHRK